MEDKIRIIKDPNHRWIGYIVQIKIVGWQNVGWYWTLWGARRVRDRDRNIDYDSYITDDSYPTVE